jgi:hypothetical protein
MFTDLNVGSAVPSYPNGWEAAAYTHVTFTVPDNWKAGRIWARRNCDFSNPNGATACLDGGCNGGLVCDSHTGTVSSPSATLSYKINVSDGLCYIGCSTCHPGRVHALVEWPRLLRCIARRRLQPACAHRQQQGLPCG